MMTQYKAPVDEVEFLLRYVLDGDALVDLVTHGEMSLIDFVTVLEAAGKFASEVLEPLNSVGDRHGVKLLNGTVQAAPGFADAMQLYREGGWIALDDAVELGGQGIPTLVANAVAEFMNSANPAFMLCPGLTLGAAHAIRAAGSEDLKRTFLPRMVTGEWTGTMNLTEPQAGTDLGAIRTKAIPEQDGTYRVFGQKIFITWGEHDIAENIVHLVLARTPDAPEGVKGISLFLVPKFLVNTDGSLGDRNDVTCTAVEHKLGIHGSPTCVMQYGEQDGAIGFLVGEENRGLEHMFVMMNESRIGIGIQSLGVAERAYQKAMNYARERIQGKDLLERKGASVAIARHPDVQRTLLSMKSLIDAMRGMALQAGAWQDLALRSQEPAERQKYHALLDLLTPVLKGWLSECTQTITYDAIQTYGGMGFIEETGIAQHYRDARIFTIYEGTTAIQGNDLVNRKIQADGGKMAKAIIGLVHEAIDELRHFNDRILSNFADRLSQASGDLEGATAWVVDTYRSNPKAAHAGAVPYLHLWGLVLGGWMHARILSATKKLESTEYSQKFLSEKLASARFFGDYYLTKASGLSIFVKEGTSYFADIDDIFRE